LTNGCGQGNLLQTKYYYHYTKWFDMDGDGDLDLVTARSSELTNPTNVSESGLVWLQNPGKAFSPTARTWKLYDIDAAHNVVDTAFDIMSMNGVIYVVAGGFSSGKMALLSGTTAAWSSGNVQTTLVASGTQFYFDTVFADMNGDLVPDVIVTIGSYGVQNGMLQVYPGQLSGSTYSLGDMKMIYDQFPVWNSASLGSPGNAFQFYYSQAQKAAGALPSILISGDDDGQMYMADPLSTDPATFDWTYETDVIYKTKNFNPFVTILTAPTIGQPTIADLNGDGCTDIIVAGYSVQQLVFLEQRNTRGCMP